MSDADGLTETPKERTPRYAWLILIIVFLCSVVPAMAQMKVPPLARWLFQAYHLDGASFGLMMSSFTIIGIFLALPAAWICRGLGLKKTMIISMISVIIGGLVEVISPSYEVLLIGRLVEGVGLGLVGVAAPACVSVWFPLERRGTALGIWSAWMPVGIVLIYNIAPAIANSFGYLAVFWMVIVLAVVSLCLFVVFFKNPTGKSADFGIEGTFKQSLGLLKNKYIWMLGGVFFLYSIVNGGVINTYYNTFLETSSWQMSSQTASSMTSIATAIGIFISPAIGIISDKFSPDRKWIPLAASFALLFIAYLFAWDESQISAIWFFIIAAGVANAAISGASRPLGPYLMGGTAMGATVSMAFLLFGQNLGRTIGSPVFGALYDAVGWSTASAYFVLPCIILAIVLCFFLRSKKGK